MIALIIILRIVHIFAGIFWAGVAFLNAFILQPGVGRMGPEGGPFMQTFMRVTSLSRYVSAAALLATASGVILWIIRGPRPGLVDHRRRIGVHAGRPGGGAGLGARHPRDGQDSCADRRAGRGDSCSGWPADAGTDYRNAGAGRQDAGVRPGVRRPAPDYRAGHVGGALPAVLRKGWARGVSARAVRSATRYLSTARADRPPTASPRSTTSARLASWRCGVIGIAVLCYESRTAAEVGRRRRPHRTLHCILAVPSPSPPGPAHLNRVFVQACRRGRRSQEFLYPEEGT